MKCEKCGSTIEDTTECIPCKLDRELKETHHNLLWSAWLRRSLLDLKHLSFEDEKIRFRSWLKAKLEAEK